MKKTVILLIWVSLIGFLGCSSSTSPPPLLTVITNISTSDTQDSPPAVDPVNQIILEFSEPLNMNTVEGQINFYTVKSGGQILQEPLIEVVFNAQTPNKLIIKTKNGADLPSGEEYKIVISTFVQSLTGHTLVQDFVGYFATDYKFSLVANPVPELGNNRTIIVVISDIHLGDARSINEGYGWFNKNRTALLNFLNLLRQNPNMSELVIAGDLFDEWVLPMDKDTFNGIDQSAFVDMIVLANKPIIDAINDIINDANIKVTYVPGNHDMLVESKDIQRIFPGISEARDADGLGAYSPLDLSTTIIEHGHRYDFFNAPDPISNRSITQTNSKMPPGFFVSKIATTSDQERGISIFIRKQLTDSARLDAQNYLSYWAAWQLIMSQKPVQESWSEKIIKTGIDGYTDQYAINDVVPYYSETSGPFDVNLYKGIVDQWYNRQDMNKVAVPILAEIAMAAGAFNPALDAQATVQYFLNKSSDKRIVVFGHTHEAGLYSFLNYKLQGTIYANSGTWVDNGNPSCTFVTIIPQKDNNSVSDSVSVYQYVDDNNIKKIKSAVIITN